MNVKFSGTQSVTSTTLTRGSAFFNGEPPYNITALNKLQGYFKYLSPKKELKDLHSTKQRVSEEETVVVKITAKC